MRNSTEVHTNFQLTLDVDRRQRRLLRAREIRKGDCERRYIGRISPMTWVPTNADSVGQLVVMGLEMGARLRRRIETGPARPRYIRTERGAGYLFAVPVQTIYQSESIGRYLRPIDPALRVGCDYLRARLRVSNTDLVFNKGDVTMKSKTMVTIAAAAAALAVAGGAAISAQDKSTLKVPGGLAFSEFKGYENWAVIASHHTDTWLEAIIGNAVAMNAFRAGIPANGKPFPDGSKMAKVIWNSKKSPDAPFDVKVPVTVYGIEFMVKDAKRFPDGGGWGYAFFVPDGATGNYKPAGLDHVPPQGNDAKCGVACHNIAKGKDYVFTEYLKRP